MTLSADGGHSAFYIPLGGVAHSSLAGLWLPTGAFSLSFVARPCLTTLPAAGTFFDFWVEGPLAGATIEDDDYDEASVVGK